MDATTGGGFNTFGFLSMMIAGYNLVGLIANNGNQNNNNNDNNDNINNNNNQNVNEATTDTMGPMSMGTIIVPPLPPGRALNFANNNNNNNNNSSVSSNNKHNNS